MSLTPNSKGKPIGKLADAIDKKWSSFEISRQSLVKKPHLFSGQVGCGFARTMKEVY